MKESLQRLILYAIRHGPFDGVLGFGQGATVGALLASCCETFLRTPKQVCYDLGVELTAGDMPKFKFFVSIAGWRLASSTYDHFYAPQTTVKSLHLVLEMCPFDLVAHMDALPLCFEQAEVVQYFRWHSRPTVKDSRSKICAFVLPTITEELSPMLHVRDESANAL